MVLECSRTELFQDNLDINNLDIKKYIIRITYFTHRTTTHLEFYIKMQSKKLNLR